MNSSIGDFFGERHDVLRLICPTRSGVTIGIRTLIGKVEANGVALNIENIYAL